MRRSDGFEVESTSKISIEHRKGQPVLANGVAAGNYGDGPLVSIVPDAFASWHTAGM